LKPLEILQKYWKHDNFRNSQEKIIETVLANNDVLALLPTGGGKSICYQIPALIKDGVCIVVTPLIALMQDQVENLKSKGIKAIAVTSKLSEDEIIVAFDNMMYGNIKFLYLSPEKLQSELIQSKIKQLKVNLIAIDEAHCISEWGHDFRPSYLQINILRELQPSTNFIAVTATATSKVVEDITKYLELKKTRLFKETFYRVNLAYQVFKTEDILTKVKQILTKIKQPVIVYVNTRKQTKAISDYLKMNYFTSTYYHGGMSAEDKEISFKNWMLEKQRVMVATNAFGMGIDKDNVKVVIHIDVPNSVENYIQEAGRAGRNGKKAFSVILYNNATIHGFEQKIEKNSISIAYIKKIYTLLNQYLYIAKGELSLEKYNFDVQKFCAKYQLNVPMTFTTIDLLEKENVLTLESNFKRKSLIQFKSDSKSVLTYTKQHQKSRELMQLLLRSYGGVFDNRIGINETYLANKLNIAKATVIIQLKQLQKDGIIEYIYQSNNTKMLFLVMREDEITINRISKNIQQRNRIKNEKAKDIITYITKNKVCRSKQILHYFEEKDGADCGVCDVCLQQKKTSKNRETLATKICLLFNEKQEISSKEIVILLEEKEQEILETIQLLLEKKVIQLTIKNKYRKV